MTLPDTKHTPGQDPLNKKTIIYGPQKIGKTTLVSKLYPNAVFITTDPTGFEELEVYSAKCPDWATFRRIGGELAQYLASFTREGGGEDGPLYDAICVDTVDELVRQCRYDVLGKLSGKPAQRSADDFLHESDWDYGKAWNAVAEEFRLRVARLCNLGLPVVFVSHSKLRNKKDRTGLEVEVHSPDIGSGALREWLLKFVDYIFFAEMLQTSDGERRILRTAPSETYLAGYRWPESRDPLPDSMPLDGARLRAALIGSGTGRKQDGTMSVEEAREDLKQPKTNGKAEPKSVQDARKIVESIDEERVKDSGYSAKEQKALQTIAKHEAKQKEAATA